MNLAELRKEYAEQDNRITAYPIYVTVQELVCIGVMAEGYSVNGDGVNKTQYKHPEYESPFDSLDEFKEQIHKDCEDYVEAENIITDIQEINLGYIWHPVEFFLTIKGAEKYIKANAHNHGELRTYVGHFERRNFEMRGLLEELGFKTKD